jgi:hypothetical protein
MRRGRMRRSDAWYQANNKKKIDSSLKLDFKR